MITFLIIYAVGFVLNVLFYAAFGKKIGFDYSGPKDDYYDDWDNNVQAYTAFSMMWPIMNSVLLLGATWRLLTYLVGLIVKD